MPDNLEITCGDKGYCNVCGNVVPPQSVTVFRKKGRTVRLCFTHLNEAAWSGYSTLLSSRR